MIDSNHIHFILKKSRIGPNLYSFLPLKKSNLTFFLHKKIIVYKLYGDFKLKGDQKPKLGSKFIH